jgi:hypothetical protein
MRRQGRSASSGKRQVICQQDLARRRARLQQCVRRRRVCEREDPVEVQLQPPGLHRGKQIADASRDLGAIPHVVRQPRAGEVDRAGGCQVHRRDGIHQAQAVAVQHA